MQNRRGDERIQTQEDLKDYIDGLYAHHLGFDDELHAVVMKKLVLEHLLPMTPDERRVAMARVVRDIFLSDEAIAKGYGCEDAYGLICWLSEDLKVLP